MDTSKLSSHLHLGTRVLVGLALLTLVEYVVSVGLAGGALVPLVVIALAKAGLIARYFMHVVQLWRREGHGHE